MDKSMKNSYLFSVIAVCSMFVFSTATLAEEAKDPEKSDWEFKLGAGMGYSPDYEGSDDYEAQFMPNVEITWKDRVNLSMGGLMVDVYQGENLTLGLGAGMSESRKESDNEALRGLGKIDSSIDGVLYGSYDLEIAELEASIAQDLGDGHEGTLVELGANFFIPVSKKVRIMAGPDMTWASEDYMQSFFGVTSKQAGNSVYSKYDVGSGVKDVGLHLMAEYPITESVSLNAMVEYKRLLGDAADSPIVKSEDQFFGGLMLNYTF